MVGCDVYLFPEVRYYIVCCVLPCIISTSCDHLSVDLLLDQIDLSPAKAYLLPGGSRVPRPKKLARINVADSMDPEDRVRDGVRIFKLNLGGVGR